MQQMKIINGASDYVIEDHMDERDRDLCNECSVNKIAYMFCVSCVTLFCDSCTDAHLKRSVCKADVKRFINWNMLFNKAPYCDYHPTTLCNVFCNRCLAFTCKFCVESMGSHNCQNHLDSSISMRRELRYKSWVAMQEARFWVETFYNLQSHVETRLTRFSAMNPVEHSHERMEHLEKKEMCAIFDAKIRETARHIASCKEFADEYDQRESISVADMMKIMQICNFESKRDILSDIMHKTCEYLSHCDSDENMLTHALPNILNTPLHYDSHLAMYANDIFENFNSMVFADDRDDDNHQLMVLEEDRENCNVRKFY